MSPVSIMSSTTSLVSPLVYPSKVKSPPTNTRPVTSDPTGAPFSSRMRTAQPTTGLPTVSGASRRSIGVARAPIPTSDEP